MYAKTLLFLALVTIATTTITYSCLAISPFNQIFAQQQQQQQNQSNTSNNNNNITNTQNGSNQSNQQQQQLPNDEEQAPASIPEQENVQFRSNKNIRSNECATQ